MSKASQTVFDRIRLLADACGMTLAQLCDMCGINRTHVYRFRYPGPVPSGKLLASLTDRTGVEAHWILTGRGEMWVAGHGSGRYPNRTRAVAKARDMQFSEASIEAALRLAPASDQSLAWWILQIAAAEAGGERKSG
jgi:transcriptional regulator with XRE-family HTH domain